MNLEEILKKYASDWNFNEIDMDLLERNAVEIYEIVDREVNKRLEELLKDKKLLEEIQDYDLDKALTDTLEHFFDYNIGKRGLLKLLGKISHQKAFLIRKYLVYKALETLERSIKRIFSNYKKDTIKIKIVGDSKRKDFIEEWAIQRIFENSMKKKLYIEYKAQTSVELIIPPWLEEAKINVIPEREYVAVCTRFIDEEIDIIYDVINGNLLVNIGNTTKILGKASEILISKKRAGEVEGKIHILTDKNIDITTEVKGKKFKILGKNFEISFNLKKVFEKNKNSREIYIYNGYVYVKQGEKIKISGKRIINPRSKISDKEHEKELRQNFEILSWINSIVDGILKGKIVVDKNLLRASIDYLKISQDMLKKAKGLLEKGKFENIQKILEVIKYTKEILEIIDLYQKGKVTFFDKKEVEKMLRNVGVIYPFSIKGESLLLFYEVMKNSYKLAKMAIEYKSISDRNALERLVNAIAQEKIIFTDYEFMYPELGRKIASLFYKTALSIRNIPEKYKRILREYVEKNYGKINVKEIYWPDTHESFVKLIATGKFFEDASRAYEIKEYYKRKLEINIEEEII